MTCSHLSYALNGGGGGQIKLKKRINRANMDFLKNLKKKYLQNISESNDITLLH